MQKCRNAKCDVQLHNPISVPSTGEQTRLAAAQKKSTNTKKMKRFSSHDGNTKNGDGQALENKVCPKSKALLQVHSICEHFVSLPPTVQLSRQTSNFPMPVHFQPLRVQNTNLSQNYSSREEKLILWATERRLLFYSKFILCRWKTLPEHWEMSQ